MSRVKFEYNQTECEIQCNENELMKEICKRFAKKVNLNLSNLYFMYSGAILNLELPYKKTISSSDSKNKCFKVLVYTYADDTRNENNNLIKSKQIICPSCSEIAICEILDNRIKLSCQKGHMNELTITQFENSQKINQSKIICDLCKNNNKANTFENKFYYCIKCKKNLCPLCKESHIKNESSDHIVDYEQKYFYCGEHYEKYYSYCKTCSKNLCPQCENSHNNHQILYYGKILIDEKELRNKLYSFKNIRDNFIKSLEDIIEKLKEIKDNSEKLYKINEDLVNDYLKSSSNRNYQLLTNLQNLNSKNKYMDKMNQIINEKNILTRTEKIFSVFFGIKSENKEQIIKKEPKIDIALPLFTIRSSCNENKCIDTKSLNCGDFAQIWDYKPNNKNQIFEMIKGTKEGYYSIRNHFSGYYLGIDFSTGDWRISFKKKSETPQNFKLIDCKNGFYIIQEENSYAVDLANFKTDNGSYVGFCNRNGNSAQQWKLVLI